MSASSSALGAGAGGPEAAVIDAVGDDVDRRPGETTSARRVAVASLTAIRADARRAETRMAAVKKATLARWCHSGWVKNDRSWTVTTVGTRAARGIV